MGSDTLTDKAPFEQFAEKAKRAVGWRFYELDGSHCPNVAVPNALMELLERFFEKNRPRSFWNLRRQFIYPCFCRRSGIVS
jgi:hypothetical protein